MAGWSLVKEAELGLGLSRPEVKLVNPPSGGGLVVSVLDIMASCVVGDDKAPRIAEVRDRVWKVSSELWESENDADDIMVNTVDINNMRQSDT